jgi:hypothetical protein
VFFCGTVFCDGGHSIVVKFPTYLRGDHVGWLAERTSRSSIVYQDRECGGCGARRRTTASARPAGVGVEDYLRTYVQKCPAKAVSLEVIVSGQPRLFNYRDPKFWENYRNTPAWELSRFLALCDKGQPNLEPPPDPAKTPAERQLANVEASIKWTQGLLAKL